MGYASKIIKPVLIVGYWYVKTFTNLFNIAYKPFLNFIGNYSPTIQKSLDEIVPTIYKFMLSIPLVLPIILFSAFIMGDITSLQSIIDLYSELTDVQYALQTSLTFIIGLFGLSIIILSSIYNMNSSIKMSGLVVLSAIPILYLQSPNVYVYIATLIFSIGAYSTTVIEFRFSKSIYNIMDEDKPQVNAQAYTFMYVIFIVPTMLLINVNFTSEITFIFTLVLSLIAYVFISAQKNVYESVYNHVRTDKSSRVFMYPARVSIVYAIGITLFTQSVSMFIAALYFIPAIMFLLFTHYITRSNPNKNVNSNKLSEENIVNSQNATRKQGGHKPEVSKLEYNTKSPQDNKSTELQFTMDIKIPEEMNAKDEVWTEFLKTTNDVEKILTQIKTVDVDVDLDAYNEFQNDVIEKGFSEFKNSDSVKLYELPKNLLVKIQNSMHKTNDSTMDDIVEAEMIINDKSLNEINQNKYIE